jgi:alkylhydroperoxidase family enzyme
VKLTATPQRVGAADLVPLRATGLSDTDIHDLVQVIAYFNYITRIADGLGTDPEPEMGTMPAGWRP